MADKYKISIIMPVLNEASTINKTVGSIAESHYSGEFEIIIVDGSSHGDTLNAVEEKDVKKVISKKGRSSQMNKGASLASGEILLFLHADTELPEGALSVISSVVEKDGFVGGAFDLAIRSDKFIFRVIEKAASLRTRITRIPYGDQAIFMRKDYFNAMGGFKEIPLMEDVEFMTRVKKSGNKIHIIPEKVRTSPRRWEKEGIIYCTFRNWLLIVLYTLGFPPEKLVKLYK